MKKVDIKLIKNGDYINTYYNDERFLLVDEYTINNKKFHQFSSIDKSIFFEIINGDYYEVDDLETVNELYDLAYLNEPDIYYGLTKFVAKVPMTIAFSNLQEIEDKVKNNIFKYTLEKLKMIGCSASEEYLQSRLEKALFYYGDNRFFTQAAAAYHPDFNMVVVPFDSFTVDLVFHETIHAISNVKHLYRLGLGIGLIEGSTETINLKATAKKRSSFYQGYEFNFHKCGYWPLVSIVLQMEYLLNETCTDSIVLSKKDFYDDFINKYGSNLFIYTKHIMNKMTHKNFDLKILFDLQNRLLHECFDKELININSIEDASNYLKRLNEFGSTRIRDKYSDDPILKQYYNEKLIQIKNKLLELSISEHEIDKLLDDNKYKKVEFLTRYYIDEYDIRIKAHYKEFISMKKLDSSMCECYSYEISGKVYSCIIMNGEIVDTREYDLNDDYKVQSNIIINDNIAYYNEEKITLKPILINNSIIKIER